MILSKNGLYFAEISISNKIEFLDKFIPLKDAF
jgi:hypothetical protein